MTMDQNWAQPNVPAQPAKKPGIVGLVVAIVLIVAGPILIVIGSLNFTSGVGSAEVYYSNDFPAQVDLKAGDETGIWLEHDANGFCQVLDPMMLPVPISTSGFGSQTVNEYDLAATFIPPSDGAYTVICSATLIPFQFKVAPTMHVAGFVIGLVAGIFLLFAGIILLIITLLRRTRTRNNQSFAWPPIQPGYAPSSPASGSVPPSQPDYGTLPQPSQYPPSPQPQFPSSPPAPTVVPSAQPPQYAPAPQPPAPQPDYGLPPQPVYGAFPRLTPPSQSAPEPSSAESPSSAAPPDMPSFIPPPSPPAPSAP